MNEEERKLHENIRRVAINIGVLLDVGLFPGKHALGIEECRGYVQSVVNDATAKLSALAPPPQATPPTLTVQPSA